jgi:hypothetical protein
LKLQQILEAGLTEFPFAESVYTACTSLFDKDEMGYAEGDQDQVEEHPRDAQTGVAGGETEAEISLRAAQQDLW